MTAKTIEIEEGSAPFDSAAEKRLKASRVDADLIADLRRRFPDKASVCFADGDNAEEISRKVSALIGAKGVIDFLEDRFVLNPQDYEDEEEND